MTDNTDAELEIKEVVVGVDNVSDDDKKHENCYKCKQRAVVYSRDVPFDVRDVAAYSDWDFYQQALQKLKDNFDGKIKDENDFHFQISRIVEFTIVMLEKAKDLRKTGVRKERILQTLVFDLARHYLGHVVPPALITAIQLSVPGMVDKYFEKGSKFMFCCCS